MSQIQDFLNIHLGQVPIKPNQERTMEMRDEVLSSGKIQDMDTSGLQVSDLEDIECHWEDSDFNMDAVFRQGVDTSVSLSTFNDFKMGSMTEKPFLIDEEQHEEKLHPFPTTPVSKRPTQSPALMRLRPFATMSWERSGFCS